MTMQGGSTLRDALCLAEAELAAGGVPSPSADARALAAHLLGVDRGRLTALELAGARAPEGLDELVGERRRRVPLQHLTGRAPFRTVELRVGPGVFVPRPETETTAGLAVDEASRLVGTGDPAGTAVVVDLCSGSGAIALAVTTEVPQARVHAVELSAQAHAWAVLNLAGSGVELRLGDAADAYHDLDGQVDVVVTNPPYIPPGAVPAEPEVRDHDPRLALYGGGHDGLHTPLLMLAAARRLLRDGGLVVLEHADVQQPALTAALWASGGWTQVTGHSDLAGRPRALSARRRRDGVPAVPDSGT